MFLDKYFEMGIVVNKYSYNMWQALSGMITISSPIFLALYGVTSLFSIYMLYFMYMWFSHVIQYSQKEFFVNLYGAWRFSNPYQFVL